MQVNMHRILIKFARRMQTGKSKACVCSHWRMWIPIYINGRVYDFSFTLVDKVDFSRPFRKYFYPNLIFNPSLLPSELGMNWRIAPASLDMGMVCSQMRPGPVSETKNRPSPPKRTFLIPLTIWMS